jgi:hypothetical protein
MRRRSIPFARGTALLLALSAAMGGCAMDDEKGPEEELPLEGKDDSFRRPTNHGLIEFGIGATSVLTTDERFHTWVFELTDTAKVDIVTSYALLGQRRTDTVLYLYREGYAGWGSYIARNDDYGSTTYSRLQRDLEPGRYRLLVKGHSETTRGKFKVTTKCDGPGCARGCLFGTTYHELKTAPALTLLADYDITAANLDTLGAAAQSMLVRAVHESSHTDVTTALEALARVDDERMNVSYYVEPAALRTFIAIEYGAGDNSYGAVFEKQSTTRATSIHDGDLYNCAVTRETCALPADYATMKQDPAFTRTALRAVTAASQLTAAESAQATLAFPLVYGEPISVSDGLALADGGSINVARYTHVDTGSQVTVFEWGAGDTSVGALFHGGTTNLAGVIDDLSINGCSLFVPR